MNTLDHNQDYAQIARSYLDLLGGEDEILIRALNAIEKTNIELAGAREKWGDDHAKIYCKGQLLGHMVETNLAEQMDGCGGFKFVQGKEQKNHKDIECIYAPYFLDKKYNSLPVSDESNFDVSTAHSYGIEVKFSTTKKISGSKSYAKDKHTARSKKDKYSFYILISNGRITDDIQISDDFDVYFCFLVQEDWSAGDAGNFASPKVIEERMIQIY